MDQVLHGSNSSVALFNYHSIHMFTKYFVFEYRIEKINMNIDLFSLYLKAQNSECACEEGEFQARVYDIIKKSKLAKNLESVHA